MNNLFAQIDNTSGIRNPVINPAIGASPEGGSALAITMANLFRVSLIVGGLSLLLYLAWGGLNWITSGGDPEKVSSAKDKITQAIAGMAILVATIAITLLLSTLFGFDLLNPTIPEPPASVNSLTPPLP